jgi:cytochrome b561
MEDDVEKAAEGQSYGFVARSFHWILFGLIAAQYIVGSAMPHIGKDTTDEGLVAWHMSIGTAIMFFVFLRLAWRIANPVPLPSDLPGWQNRLAHVTHAMLYVLIIVMVLLGWATTGYRGWTVYLFGILPLPSLAEKGSAWAHTAGDIHDWMVYVLAAFIILHIVAALYHYFVVRDRVLQRMLPAAR